MGAAGRKRDARMKLVNILLYGGSFLGFLAALAGYVQLRSPVLLSGSILAFLIAAGNLIPLGNNDMAMLLREIRNRNGYTK